MPGLRRQRTRPVGMTTWAYDHLKTFDKDMISMINLKTYFTFNVPMKNFSCQKHVSQWASKAILANSKQEKSLQVPLP